MEIAHLESFVLHLWVERIIPGPSGDCCISAGCRTRVSYRVVAQMLEGRMTFVLGLCEKHAKLFPHFKRDGWNV